MVYRWYIGKTLVKKSLEFHGDLRSPVPGLPTWPASPRPDESTRHRGVAVPTLLRLLRPLAFSSLLDRSSWYGHRMKMNGYNIVEYMKIQLIWKSSWYGNIYIYIYIWIYMKLNTNYSIGYKNSRLKWEIGSLDHSLDHYITRSLYKYH